MAQTTESIINIDVDIDKAVAGIAALRKQYDELADAQDRLKSEIKKAGGASDEQRQQQARLTEQQKALKREMRDLSKEAQNEIKLIKSKQTSYNALSAQYSKLKKQINAMTKEERAQNKAMIEESNRIYEQMKKMQAETGMMQLNVGNYTNSIVAALTGNNRFATSLIGLGSAGNGISGMFKAATSAAGAFGKALMALMANPVFIALAGIVGAGAAFKWFYDYNKGLAEATRLTKQFSGLTGESLNNLRDSVQATADTFGKDFKETLQGVDTLVAQYGISWKEANDIINKGFAAGADLNEDFLQNIQQYGPALKDAGLSAEELVAVIQQTRSGIFGKDGLDIITKASKNLRDMSKGTAEALQGVGINADELKQKLADGSITMMEAIQQVSGALKGVSANSQEAGAIISDVFGKKGVAAGQEQLKAFEDLNMSLDSLIEGEGEYGKVQMELVETQKELNAYTAALFGMDGWDTMLKQIELVVKKGLVKVVKWVVDVINYFIDWYNESMLVRIAVNAIITGIKNGWEVIKLAFNLIIDAVKSVGRVLHGLGDIVEGVFTLNWDKISGGWDTIIKNFGATWKEMAVDARNAGTAIGNNMMEGIDNAINGHMKHISVNLDASDVGGSAMSVGGGSSTSSEGGSGKSGGGKNGKSGGRSGGKTEAEKAAEKAEKEAQKRRENWLKEYQRAEAELDRLIVKTREQQEQALLDGYNSLIESLKEKRNAEVENADIITDIITKKEEERDIKVKELRQRFSKEELSDRQKLIQARLENAAKGSQAELQLQVELYRLQKQQQELEIMAMQTDEETRQQLLYEIRRKYNKMEADARNAWDAEQHEKAKESAEKLYEIEKAKYQGIAELMGHVSDAFGEIGESNKAFLILSKSLAIAEVAIQQGIAIAHAVRAAVAGSSNWIQAAVQIAAGVATVISTISSALKSINGAKFAEGGDVVGPGTGTSDSVPAMLSNGESVITAAATAKYAPLLSAINQAGGGLPINGRGVSASVAGDDALTRTLVKAMEAMPQPVVSVKEITDTQKRVATAEKLASL